MADEVTTLNELLVNEIGSQIDFLQNQDPGTETHEKCVKDISILYKVYNEENDLANKYEDIQARKAADEARTELEKEKLEFEKEKLKYEQTQAVKTEEKEKKQKVTDLVVFGIEQVVKIGTLIVPLMFYRRMFREGIEFEQTGSVSSKFFGNLINKQKPTRVD